jgi:hypothetical protein
MPPRRGLQARGNPRRCANQRVCPASEKAWRTNASPVSDSGGLSCQPILQTVGKERSVAPNWRRRQPRLNWRQCFRILHRNGRFSPPSSIAQTVHSPLGRCPSQNALNTRAWPGYPRSSFPRKRESSNHCLPLSLAAVVTGWPGQALEPGR